jgi:hypothetical protein
MVMDSGTRSWGKGSAIQENQTVSDVALEVLTRQARTHSKRTGEPFEEALEAVLSTEAGRHLRKLSEGPHRHESAQQWQEDLPRKRANERRNTRRKERRQARQKEFDQARLVAWKAFMQAERRELVLRKEGQLARMLGEPLPGESAAEVLELASEDRRQAEEGLVALMRDGKVFYKYLEELSEWDMPARKAANRLRTTWLKERQEHRWFGSVAAEQL